MINIDFLINLKALNSYVAKKLANKSYIPDYCIDLLFSVTTLNNKVITRKEKVIFIKKSNSFFKKLKINNMTFDLDNENETPVTAKTAETAETAETPEKVATFSDMVTAQISLITFAQKNLINPEKEVKTLELLFSLQEQLRKFVPKSEEFKKALKEQADALALGNELQKIEIRELKRKLKRAQNALKEKSDNPLT